jgi:hypothetical protein
MTVHPILAGNLGFGDLGYRDPKHTTVIPTLSLRIGGSYSEIYESGLGGSSSLQAADCDRPKSKAFRPGMR